MKLWPKSQIRKFLRPGKEEAEQWVENGICRLGSICAPNSDCWGSGSDVCYSDTHDWVPERTFKYLNMWWTTEWRETWTLDWKCHIINKEIPIHYNSEGKLFIVLDDDKVSIFGLKDGALLHRKTYNVFIPKNPKENSLTFHMSCYKHKKDLLCEGANDE